MVRTVAQLASRIGRAAAAPAVAALRSPVAASGHPRSRELDDLIRAGWAIAGHDLTVSPARATVRLRRGDEERTVESAELAFVAHAASVVHRHHSARRLRVVLD